MEKLNFALVGTGHIAHVHARAIKSLKNANLIAVRGSDKSHTESFAKKFGAQAYTDYESLLKKENIDVVDIVAQSNMHADFGVLAAEAGKHVIVEKPIDISLEKADLLINACRKNGVKLSVISQHRFDSAVIALKKAIDAGDFGRLFFGRAAIHWQRTQEYYDTSNWRKNIALAGGGALMTQAIHYIDILRWLFGDVESVSGEIATVAHKIEVEDIGTGILRFKSGALGQIEGDTAVQHNMPNTIEAHGTSGSAILNGWRFANRAVLWQTSRSFDFRHLLAFMPGTIRNQILNFTSAIKTNALPAVTGEDGRTALEIVLAIYKSAMQKCEVALPL